MQRQFLVDPFNEFWNHAMILVGFYFSISFWACCWGFSILDPYYYRLLVNGRKGKTIMRFPTWRHRVGIKMRAVGCVSQVALNWQIERERGRGREGESEGETRELIVDTAYPTRSGGDFSWSGRSPNQELAAQQMLLVMGIMCSNPDKKDDAIDGALLRAWDKMKQEQGAIAASIG